MPALTTRVPRVYAAAVTPRRLGLQDINLGAVWDLMDLLSSRSLDGIVLFGAGSDCRHFSPQEQLRLVGLAVRRSRIPLILRIAHPNMDGAVELAEGAQAAGMEGLLLSPPDICLGDPSLTEAFLARFHYLVRPAIPVWFDESGDGRVRLPLETLRALALAGKLSGVRHGFDDGERTAGLIALQQETDFELIAGSDATLLAALDSGAAASMTPMASAIPELVIALTAGRANSDGTHGTQLRRRYGEIAAWSTLFPEPVAVREMVGLRGVKTGPHEVPFDEGREAKLAEFRNWFAAWLPLVEKECKRA